MTDYNKLTVKDLRALLKERDIPLTGLTRKAQYVEALEKADATENATEDATGDVAADAEQETVEETGAPADKRDEDDYTQKPVDVVSQLDGSSDDSAVVADFSREPQPYKTESGPSGTGEKEQPSESLGTTPPAEALEPTAEVSQSWGEPPVAAASGSLTYTSTLDSVRTEELVQDRLKRKRRSASPPVSDTEIAQKKLRQEVGDGTVLLKEDLSQGGHVGIPPADAAGDKVEAVTAQAGSKSDNGSPPATDAEESKAAAASKEREGRYKDILPPTPTNALEKEAANADGGGGDDRDVAPAVHPASCAIYISNLQRPLNPTSLRSHLVGLAASSDSDPDTEVIKAFFVDSVKSHAYALFTTTQAASRVRASLHDRAWPPERDRKPLWIDFIPEDKCEEWIEFEGDTSSGARPGGTRWEVTYDNAQDGVVARLVEFGGTGARRPDQPSQRNPVVDFDRSRQQATAEERSTLPASGPEPPRPVAPQQPEREARKFVNLDKAFRSTTNKPKLYFLPVTKDLAGKRLDEFDSLVSHTWSANRPGAPDDDQLRRYTFEDGDVLVDSGLHPIPGRGRGGGFGGGGGGPPPRRGGYGRDDGGYGAYRPR